MLVALSNSPRDYAWGSKTLIADLEGRAPSGRPEAEIWFGDHDGSPARVPDGRTLGEWLAHDATEVGAPARLPYLLKLLAAASPLSIQAHPSKAQAESGFEREEAAGIPRDAAERTYRDDNHKPELIVAISETFTALAGLRQLDATRRLIDVLGEEAAPLAQRLRGDDDATVLRDVIGWLLSGDAQGVVDGVIAALEHASSEEFVRELEVIGGVARAYPGDPGVVVALLMNVVVLRRGEGVFVPAGVLHAYLDGLGVELMAASDNVLRGGLTPKHIDIAELLGVLETTPGPAPVVRPESLATGRDGYDTPIADFALSRVRVEPAAPTEAPLRGPAIAVATGGAVIVRGAASGDQIELSPGQALFATADEGTLRVTGAGELFLAQPGAIAS